MKFMRKKVLSNKNQNKISNKSCPSFKRTEIENFQKDTLKMLRQGMSICDKLESISDNELIPSCDDLFFDDENLLNKLEDSPNEKKGTSPMDFDHSCKVIKLLDKITF